MRSGKPPSCAWGGAPVLVALTLWSPPSHAQDAAGSGIRITPTLTLQETVTNNRNLSSTDPQADAITQISPGIQISSPGGRVQGSLTYSANALLYARATGSDTIQNELQANVNAEVVENRGFIAASASVSQQSISAFGTQSGGTGLVNSNSTEVSMLTVTPSWHSPIGDLADLNASLNWSGTHSRASSLGDATGHGGNVGLSGRAGLFGWGLNASRQSTGSSGATPTSTVDQGLASLSFSPDPEVQLSVNAGRQAQDVLTGSRFWTTTTGWSAAWQPTDRTNIALQGGHAYYGRSSAFSLTHRMARSVWSFSDTRDVTSPTGGQPTFRPLTLYDLYYAVCLQQGGDPNSCSQGVLAALAQQGLNPNVVYGGGFLAPTYTFQHAQNLAVSVSGLRDTIGVSAFRNETSPLGAVAAGSDLATVPLVRQQGGTLTVSHRLTPTASLNGSVTLQKTLDAPTQPGNEQRLFLLTWADAVGPNINASLSARRTLFRSDTNPYGESAIIGSISYRF